MEGTCTACGEPLAADDMFCGSCGKPGAPATATATATVPRQAETNQDAAPPPPPATSAPLPPPATSAPLPPRIPRRSEANESVRRAELIRGHMHISTGNGRRRGAVSSETVCFRQREITAAGAACGAGMASAGTVVGSP